MRSGDIPIDNGHLWSAGEGGRWWTASAASNIWGNLGSGGYYFVIDPSIVRPLHGPNNRWYSFPLRWLVAYVFEKV